MTPGNLYLPSVIQLESHPETLFVFFSLFAVQWFSVRYNGFVERHHFEEVCQCPRLRVALLQLTSINVALCILVDELADNERRLETTCRDNRQHLR